MNDQMDVPIETTAAITVRGSWWSARAGGVSSAFDFQQTELKT